MLPILILVVPSYLPDHHPNKETLSLRHAKGHVWSRNNLNQCTIVIKLAITASAICDQSPTTEGLKPVIDLIIASINLKFIVNRIAILSFDMAIPTRKHGNVYFSYAFLSPRSTNLTITPTPSPTTARHQLEILKDASTPASTDHINLIQSPTYPPLHHTYKYPSLSSMTWMRPSASSLMASA